MAVSLGVVNKNHRYQNGAVCPPETVLVVGFNGKRPVTVVNLNGWNKSRWIDGKFYPVQNSDGNPIYSLEDW